MPSYKIEPRRRPCSATSARSAGPVQFYVTRDGALVTIFKTRAKAEAFVARCAAR